MESSEYLVKFTPFLRRNLLAFILGGLGLLLLFSGLLSLLNHNENDIVLETSGDETGSISAQIAVDVSGAVIKPGLYMLQEGSRIHDALVSAGGLSNEADRSWVDKNLNLALRLKDGVKIYIPKETEEGFVQGAASSVDSLININSASSKELESLPGIGVVTAGKIIDNRPYGSLEELLSKKVITSRVFDQIKDKISAF